MPALRVPQIDNVAAPIENKVANSSNCEIVNTLLRTDESGTIEGVNIRKNDEEKEIRGQGELKNDNMEDILKVRIEIKDSSVKDSSVSQMEDKRSTSLEKLHGEEENNKDNNDHLNNEANVFDGSKIPEGNQDLLSKDNEDVTNNSMSRRLRNIVDSDSEYEAISPSTKNDANAIEDHSESEEIFHSSNKKKKHSLPNRSIRKIIDSDSDNDNDKVSHESNFNEEDDTENKKNAPLRFKTLLDSDSEEEEYKITSRPKEEDEIMESTQKPTKQKHEKKRKGSARASKDEAMRQIHSETQRLVRESNICLPYHRPKQRTLQEFLNRKTISGALPMAPTVAARLKMSTEIVRKLLEEKEKEAELFYKSSDSEEEEQRTNTFFTDTSKTKNISSDKQLEKLIGDATVENTHTTEQSNMEQLCNREENQQVSAQHSVSRKLFTNDEDELQNKKAECDTLVLCENNVVDENRVSEEQDLKEDKQNSAHIPMETEILSQVTEQKMNDLNATNLKDNSSTDRSSSKINIETNDFNRFEKELKNNKANEQTTEEMNKIKDNCEGRTMNTSESFETSNAENIALVQNDKEATEKQITLHSEDSHANNENNMLQENSTEPDEHLLGLPLSNLDEENQVSSIKKQLLLSLPDFKPTLKGSPGMTINLSDNINPHVGVNKLLDRFFTRHSSLPKPTTPKSEVTVVHLEETVKGPMPVKTTLPYALTVDDNENPELSKPGAKLLRLKEDLELKMALKRTEEWKQKEQEYNDSEEHYEEDEDNMSCADDMNKLKNDEDSSSGESEPEENDMPITERKKTKCMFADEEAEVSDDEGSRDSNGELNEESEEEVNGKTEREIFDDDTADNKEKDVNHSDSNEGSDETEDDEEDGVRTKKQKKLKRIVRAFEDDSDHTSTNDAEDEHVEERRTALQREKTDIDMFASDNCTDACMSDNENDVTVFQKRQQPTTNSQICRTPLMKSSIFNFISPITQLTALNTGKSSEKISPGKKDQLILSSHIECGSVEHTPVEKMVKRQYDLNKRSGFLKKLFDESSEPVDDNELMQLCSGNFIANQKCSLNFVESQPNISESQLIDLCSGSFNTQANHSDTQSIIKLNESSRNIELCLDADSISPVKKPYGAKEDEEIQNTCKYVVVDSSEDEDTTNHVSKRTKSFRKRKIKKLELSDDENDAVASDAESERERDIIDEEDVDQYIDYDSEENEVVVIPKKDIKRAAAGFLEEEAELSESEWDSEDEDEKDLDKLEFEEGDIEDIDENQMKDQIGKIQLRQMMDEDQREVRLLKELLFEDGDLHTDGAGRERKFRWRNIDKLGDDNNVPRSMEEGDGWLDVQEDENELQWRKLRHEREKFLEKRKKETVNELENEIESNFGIFKFGMKVVNKIQLTQTRDEDTRSNVTVKPIQPRLAPSIADLLPESVIDQKSHVIYSVMQKRSLLAKGSESLARMAAIAKQNEKVSMGSVNRRKFVFEHISPSVQSKHEISETVDTEDEIDLTNKTRKRRIPFKGTPKTAKKTKLNESTTKRKKLFKLG